VDKLLKELKEFEAVAQKEETREDIEQKLADVTADLEDAARKQAA